MSQLVTIRSKKPPLPRRIRNRCERVWATYWLTRRKSRYRRQVGRPGEQTVVFVVGCQRSGTSMAIRTLDRSLDVDRFDETDPRAFVGCRIKTVDIRQELITRSTAKCVMFKPVCDCHRVTDLLAEHPRAKAVWLYRHYKDVVNSAIERWGDTSKRYIEDLLRGGGDWGQQQWNRERVTQECLAEVQEAVSDGLAPHGAAAIFWYMRNRTFFEQDLEHDPATILARYEELVTHSKREFQRLCDFLDIRFDDDLVKNVFASSIRKRPCPPVGERIEKLCDTMLERLDGARARAD